MEAIKGNGVESPQLVRAGQRFKGLFENLPVGVYRTDPKGKIIEANLTFFKMLGCQSFADVRNLNVKELFVQKEKREKHLRQLETGSGEQNSVDLKIKSRDGLTFWARDYPTAVRDDNGKIVFYDGILIDISADKKTENKLKQTLRELAHSNKERKKMISALRNLSLKDPLTGLYNRRGFMTIVKEFLHQADRKKTNMYLLYIDLDELKDINDTHGHRQGDLTLIILADILQKTFRKSDIKARIGGDEFAVFPIDYQKKGVNAAIARLRTNIKEYNALSENQPLLSISMGMAVYNPKKPLSVDELLTQADKQMYEDKKHKRKS